MTYSEFTLATVEKQFGVISQQGMLFSGLAAVAVPVWLRDLLVWSRQLALISEKARSEFIVAPVLLASRQLSGNAVSIYSGQRLDVQPDTGLVGECDFILTLSQPVPVLHAPIMTIVEAKKNDVEGGIGQCVAEMLGAQLFNQQEDNENRTVFGCVTTGEIWQFLRLDELTLTIDQERHYIDNVGRILAVFQAIIACYHHLAGTV